MLKIKELIKLIPKAFKPWEGGSNYDRDIDARSKYVNYINKEKEPVDLVISLHFNSVPSTLDPDKHGRGAEIWYYKHNDTAKNIAQNILNYTIKYTGVENRGLKQADDQYSIIYRVLPPSLIWEGAFYDDKGDRKKFLKDPDYYKEAAIAIYDGIIQSKKEKLLS